MSLILPNLICLGQPKCGTTTLYAVCKGHPDICVSDFKEPTFFSVEKDFKKGLEWYSSKYFSNFNGEKVVAEFTPLYFASDVALSNIHSSLGADTKFMVVLRSPAKRSFSHYLHLKREGLVSDPFDTLMVKLADKYSKGHDLNDLIGKMYTDSLYDVHLTNYFKYFPDRSKLLILKFEEDLKNDCKGFKKKLSDFMDLDLKKFPSSVEIKNSSQAISGFAMPLKKIVNSDNAFKRVLKKIIPTNVRSKYRVRINTFLNTKFYKSSNGMDENTVLSINRKLFLNSIKNTESMIADSLVDWY